MLALVNGIDPSLLGFAATLNVLLIPCGSSRSEGEPTGKRRAIIFEARLLRFHYSYEFFFAKKPLFWPRGNGPFPQFECQLRTSGAGNDA